VFADPEVGCASGALMIGSPGDQAKTGEAIKMDIENRIREAESRSGSCIGVTGAFYAARRALVPTIPPGTILDDMYVPLSVIKGGYRNVLVPDALAWDPIQPTRKQEFRRKVRTLTGNYQLVALAPWLVGLHNPVLFRFVGHKLARLMSPFVLVTALISNIAVALAGEREFQLFLGIQLCGHMLAALGFIGMYLPTLRRLQEFAVTFSLLNAAALVAFFNLLIRNQDVWKR
jgi:poly-beta-1,6-N-acetyl-D-glucosamine synthase